MHCPARTSSGCLGADLGWLARHLTRTKLGLALGAGGAKGYAHIGVLQVLEEAGYVVDCVAGSSIGAIVGTYLALGADAAEIEATLRGAFDPPTVAEIFKTSLSGRASGLDVMTRLLRETTEERTFADTVIPLTVMAVDLVRAGPGAAARGAAVGGAARRDGAGRRLPAPRARRAPAGRRAGAGAGADRGRRRGRRRRDACR